MSRAATLERVDAVPMIVGALTGLSIAAWLVMFGMHGTHRGGIEHVLVWATMTVGMMTPSAVPMVVAHTRISVRAQADLSVPRVVAAFVVAYLALWIAFALVAGVLQRGLHARFLIDDHMQIVSRPLAALLLIAAGVYQLTPMKRICVSKCRSPLGFLIGSFRPGYAGAFITGLQHGAFCIGCCWLLMLLAWVGGMMNIAWMAALSLLVIAEKSLPQAGRLIDIAGGVLMLGGVALLLSSGREDFLMIDALRSLCHGLL
jgi:predicted metal-binding membrane protein